jgi:methionyl-tRNA formyltransferase
MSRTLNLLFFASRPGALDAVRRHGRDRILGVQAYAPSASLHQWCEDHGVPLCDSSIVGVRATLERVATLAPDVIVSNGHPRLIGPRTRALASIAAINIHPGLLPRHRGPHPVNACLVAGDRFAGVTAHVMDDGLDTGPIITRRRIPVGPRETARSLYPRLFALEGPACLAALDRLRAGRESFIPQPEGQSFAFVRTPEAMRVDWRSGSASICRTIRAFDVETQGAYTGSPESPWRIWAAGIVAPYELTRSDLAASPGVVLRVHDSGELLVRCDDGAVLVRDHTPPCDARIRAGMSLAQSVSIT